MFGMAESNESRCDPTLYCEFLSRPGEYKERFAAGLLANVDVAPAHCFADSSAECFRDSFFRCESRSQMARREFHRQRIFDFAIGENTVEKSIAETVDRMLNARAF